MKTKVDKRIGLFFDLKWKCFEMNIWIANKFVDEFVKNEIDEINDWISWIVLNEKMNLKW
jgi:hypothetical protein